MFDGKIFCSEFKIFRCNRLHNNVGGELIVVNHCLPSSMISPSSSATVEFVGVGIKLHTCTVYITRSYIPPASDIAIYLEHLILIKIITSRLKSNDKLIVVCFVSS